MAAIPRPSLRLPLLHALGGLGIFLLGAAPGTGLQIQDDDPSPYSEVRLLSEVTSIRPGTPFTVAIHFEMEEGWHNYWRNAGDSGLPTTVAWDLPAGFSAGEIQWPTPERIVVYPLVDYGYSREVALLVDLVPPDALQEGSTVRLAGLVEWLICKDLCLPAWGEVEIELPVAAGGPEADPRWEGLFARTRASFPGTAEDISVEAEVTEEGYRLYIQREAGDQPLPDSVYFLPADESVLAHAEPQPLTREGSRLTMELVGSPYAPGPTPVLRGVLLAEEGGRWDPADELPALWVEAPVTGIQAAPTASAGGTAPTAAADPGGVTMAIALLFSFLGGVLLNLMPCVFPVLSLKILGAAGQGDRERSFIRNQGLFFGLGVELSFLALAALLLALRAGGSHLGWGFQLQSPLFVAGMATLFFGIGLNLLGVFEVGTSFTRLGGQYPESSGGYGEALASGVLATVIATPCTAPFMGAALGFALTRSAVETLLIFAVLGLGMATPFMVLSLAPGLLEKLPRPGPWMETLKQVMAFPMFATVIWLAWVFGQQTGVGGATYLLSGLLLLSMAGWLWGRWPRWDLLSGRVARSLSLGAAALALSLVVRGSAQNPPAMEVPEGWRSYDPEEVSRFVSSGHPVFLDFTAAWCLTCQVNERLVLSSERIQAAFQEKGVALFKADWTRQDPVITRALEELGRSGVPVYALYVGGPGTGPHLLPEVLTEEIVLSALEDLLPSDS